MDMCNGPLFPKIVAFAVPLILSGILQLLFNAADIIVVGHFAGRESLAAVGSTTALINLMINVFVGLSIGANVLVAQYSGAQKWKDLEETVHTAMMIALAGGILLIFVGVFFSGPMLSLMGTPDDVLPLAALYLKIYFIGMPATLTYNFGAAILRAVGDTRRPLYFLLFAGAVNVVLNLVFVIGFSMGVAGVATATVVSECISAVLIVRCLAGSDSAYRLCREKLHLTESKVKIGLPAGFQGAIFSVSNVLIQSSINSFGSIAMAGSTASANVEGFVYNAMNAVYQTALSFTSQNYGAGKMKRVTKILLYCLGLVVMVGVVMGGGAVLFGPKLLQIYSSDPEVISYGMMRMRHHGYHGGRPARSGIFRYPDAGILNRCLPVPCGMDFFCIRHAPDTDHALYFLSSQLDHYVHGSHHLLYRDPETACGAQKATGLNCEKEAVANVATASLRYGLSVVWDIMFFQHRKQQMQQGSAQADGKQIQKIGRKNANGQRNLMKDRLGAWVIGRYVEHIGLPVPRSQNVDEKGNGTAGEKYRKCPKIPLPA